jgi:hypothetical protein
MGIVTTGEGGVFFSFEPKTRRVTEIFIGPGAVRPTNAVQPPAIRRFRRRGAAVRSMSIENMFQYV